MAGKLIRRRPFAAALAAAAIFYAASAAWIPAKAQLGQALLERAWGQVLAGEAGARPWPWADTSPVAVIDIPRLDLRQVVVSGASGRNLAWAPAAMTPVAGGDVLISAHRDTHFEPLQAIERGDAIRLETPGGTREFSVASLDIVDSRSTQLVTEPGRNRLTLVTCWPFDAITAGGPLRLVVTAEPARMGR